MREANRRSFLKFAAGIGAATIDGLPVRGALVPPNFMFCVVALGGPVPEIQENALVGYRWSAVGTGFFYGRLIKPDADPKKRAYSVYLVTAKHVVEGWNILRATFESRGLENGELMIRVNPVSVLSHPTDIPLTQLINDWSPGWTSDPHGKDISVLSIDIDKLQQDYKLSFFASDTTAADREKLRELGVAAGDGTFVLGFPMGLVQNAHSAVIVREGIIARIDDLLNYGGESFMIDSFVFPGNSGGPVLLKPEVVSIKGTQYHPDPYLIGVVDAYLPYREPAVSLQTQETRVIFEENSGLASILPIDYVNDAIVADSIASEGIQRRLNVRASP